ASSSRCPPTSRRARATRRSGSARICAASAKPSRSEPRSSLRVLDLSVATLQGAGVHLVVQHAVLVVDDESERVLAGQLVDVRDASGEGAAAVRVQAGAIGLPGHLDGALAL